MAEMEIVSCIRGYHVFKSVWTHPIIGENLICKRESWNAHDRYAVGTYKRDENNLETLVGHIPKNISLLCSLFLRRGGSITCEVSGRRRGSTDLVQGGLEIPCKLTFSGKERELKKLKRLKRKKRLKK